MDKHEDLPVNIKIEIQLILNKSLYDNNKISKEMYEYTTNKLLRRLNNKGEHSGLIQC